MISKDFQVRRGLVVNTSLLVANTQTNSVSIGAPGSSTSLNVEGSVNIASSLTISSMNVTSALQNVTNQSANSAAISQSAITLANLTLMGS